MPVMKSCNTVRWAYATGDVSTHSDDEVVKHLRCCASCRKWGMFGIRSGDHSRNRQAIASGKMPLFLADEWEESCRSH